MVAARDALPGHIPTLADALDACAGAIVDIEIKNLPGEPDFDPAERVADAVVALLGRAAGAGRDVADLVVPPGDDRSLPLGRSAFATGWLTFGAVTDDDIAWVADAGHAAIHPWDPTVDRALIERCHAAGLHVNTWTCNDVARAVELASWGIDGICTDVPDVLVAAVGS